MKDIMRTPPSLVLWELDRTAETVSTAKAGLLLGEYMRVAGYDGDVSCPQKSMSGLVNSCASHLLNGRSDLNRDAH